MKIFLLLVCLTGIFGSIYYLNLPKFGTKPDEVSVIEMKKSPNFYNGSFQNRHLIPVMSSKRSLLKSALDFAFKRYPDSVPNQKIPFIKSDIKSFSEDILIWFGHSSYYIQLDGLKFLIDPIFNNHASPFPFMIKAFDGSNVYSFDDFPEIDYLIITHDHWDHLDYNTLKNLKPKIKHVITTLGVGSHLRYWGVDNELITELDWDDYIKISKGSIHCMPSRHFSGRWLERNQTLWGSFLIDINGFKVYIDGDSGYDDHYKIVSEKFGKINLALLEAGQYNQDWEYIHKNPREVIQSARDLRALCIIAGHNSKFNLAKHPWYEPLEQVSKLSKKENFKHLTPMIGEVVYLRSSSQRFEKWWGKFMATKRTS